VAEGQGNSSGVPDPPGAQRLTRLGADDVSAGGRSGAPPPHLPPPPPPPTPIFYDVFMQYKA